MGETLCILEWASGESSFDFQGPECLGYAGIAFSDDAIDLVIDDVYNADDTDLEQRKIVAIPNEAPRVFLFPDYRKHPKALDGKSIVNKPIRLSALNRVVMDSVG